MLGIGELAGPSDASPVRDTFDGPTDIPSTIRITGTVEQVDLIMGTRNPLPNAQVSLVGQPPGEGVVSDTQGKFELVIVTNGMPVDGALRGASPNERTTLQYFSRPAVEDFDATLQIYTEAPLAMLAQACQMTFQPITPVVFVLAIDNQGTPVEGATLTSMPSSTFCSQGADGTVANANRSGAGGVAFGFQLPPGPVTLSSGGPSRTITSEPQATIVVPLTTP